MTNLKAELKISCITFNERTIILSIQILSIFPHSFPWKIIELYNLAKKKTHIFPFRI